MDILLINQDWFSKELKELGHNVCSYGFYEWLDIYSPYRLSNWFDIKQKLPEGFNPELVIFHDDSAPISILGLDKIDVTTIFYSVDTHHHFNFHNQLGLFFDHTFIAQKDYMPFFSDMGVKAKWLPLWASRYLEPETTKENDAVFVGTLNRELNPERVVFFEELQKICELTVMTGNFCEIFPRSKIVINQTVKKDLNFRVFETLISGAMLLTENIDNGLSELFKDGEHLVTYEKGNIHDAAQKIKYYLENPSEALKIAEAGRNEILQKHLSIHRIQQVLDSLSEHSRPTEKPNYMGLVANYVMLASSASKAEQHELAKIYNFEAMRLANLGLLNKCSIEGEIPMFILTGLLGLRNHLSIHALLDFIESLIEYNPDRVLFKIAKIGLSSRSGLSEIAREMAAKFNPSSVNQIIDTAEEFMTHFD